MTERNVNRSGSWRATAKALEQQFAAENVLVYDGHAFEITQQLIAYVGTLVTAGKNTITVFDSAGVPCAITNLHEFFKQLLQKHVEATNTLSMAWAAAANDL